MTEFYRLVEMLGGGLTAIVMVAEGVIIWLLFKRYSAMQDKYIELSEKVREESKEMLSQSNAAHNASATAIAAVVETNRQVVRLIEDRRNEPQRLLENHR